MNEHTTTESNRSTVQAADAAAERLVRDLFSLGRAWASYGLTVAGLAMDQTARGVAKSADVLRSTAQLVESLADGFRQDAPPSSRA